MLIRPLRPSASLGALWRRPGCARPCRLGPPAAKRRARRWLMECSQVRTVKCCCSPPDLAGPKVGLGPSARAGPSWDCAETPDGPDTHEWRSRRSLIDCAGASTTYLEDEAGAALSLGAAGSHTALSAAVHVSLAPTAGLWHDLSAYSAAGLRSCREAKGPSLPQQLLSQFA